MIGSSFLELLHETNSIHDLGTRLGLLFTLGLTTFIQMPHPAILSLALTTFFDTEHNNRPDRSKYPEQYVLSLYSILLLQRTRSCHVTQLFPYPSRAIIPREYSIFNTRTQVRYSITSSWAVQTLVHTSSSKCFQTVWWKSCSSSYRRSHASCSCGHCEHDKNCWTSLWMATGRTWSKV